MNVCRTRNWLANYCMYAFENKAFERKMMSNSETDLGNLLLCLIFALFLTITVMWCYYPLNLAYTYLLKPVLTKKYKCDKV